MKIYGNSRSDGFSMFVTLVAAIFVGGGFLLTRAGGLSLLASLPVMLGLVAVMVMKSKSWDVMSEAPKAAGADMGTPVRLPNFPVKADTEAVATVGAVANALPLSVEKPKSAIETNTAVA